VPKLAPVKHIATALACVHWLFHIARFQNTIDRISLSQHETALLIFQPIPNLIGGEQAVDRDRE
jgi:hypothetical protein